jgi:hypothetical protein
MEVESGRVRGRGTGEPGAVAALAVAAAAAAAASASVVTRPQQRGCTRRAKQSHQARNTSPPPHWVWVDLAGSCENDLPSSTYRARGGGVVAR